MNRRAFLGGLIGTAAGGSRAIGALSAGQQPGTALPFRLTNVTAAAGIQFRHNSGAQGGKLLPDINVSELLVHGTTGCGSSCHFGSGLHVFTLSN